MAGNNKAVLHINHVELDKFNGDLKGYSIAALVYALYHEIYHVNVVAHKHGITKIDGLEKTGDNPDEEFLGDYKESTANLPNEYHVCENYYLTIATAPIHQLIYRSSDPAAKVTLYMNKIIYLLKLEDEAHQKESLQFIKDKPGIIIKL